MLTAPKTKIFGTIKRTILEVADRPIRFLVKRIPKSVGARGNSLISSSSSVKLLEQVVLNTIDQSSTLVTIELSHFLLSL